VERSEGILERGFNNSLGMRTAMKEECKNSEETSLLEETDLEK
jgi:hypothetical protein